MTMYSDPNQLSRAERQQILIDRMSEIDIEQIEKLRRNLPRQVLFDPDKYEEWPQRQNVDDALHKLQKYMSDFEDLNSNESRNVRLKEEELKAIAKYDWKEKFRLFIFRVLASLLFVVTIFSIGFIEHNFDWAKLPLTKYVKSIPNQP